MADTGSVIDLLLFHTFEINLYKRLVRNLRRGSEDAKRLIALWLWLESLGHHDFIRNISSFADSALEAVVKESEAALDCLGRVDPPTTSNNDMPISAGLINEPINLRFFHYHSEVATSGIEYTLHNVCNVIFSENLLQLASGDVGQQDSPSYPTGGAGRPSGEGSSWQGGLLRLSRTLTGPTAVMQQSTLNPFARPWAPSLEPTSEDQRSMFLTFSKGFPLSREEIVAFFTLKWGNCLDNVMIERAPPEQAPMFGRIVLTHSSMIPTILNGQQTAKFVVNGKQLWARIYVPRRNN